MILPVALLMLSGMFGSAGATVAAPVEYTAYRDMFLAIDIPKGSSQTAPDSFRFQHDGQWASFELTGSTPHVDERDVDCGGRPASYRVSKPKLFAYSCLVGGRIIYHVAKYGRTYRVGASDGTETIEFTINYPASQRAFWNPVVSHMSETLRFPAARKKV